MHVIKKILLRTDRLLRPSGGVQFSKRLDLILGCQFWKCKRCRGGGGVEILRQRIGLLCKSCQAISWLKQIHVSFKSRRKKLPCRFLVSSKMLPISSSVQEPISYFYYQECSVHIRTYAYAYTWNLEKIYNFSFISWKHFYHWIGILKTISHYIGVFVLGFGLYPFTD